MTAASIPLGGRDFRHLSPELQNRIRKAWEYRGWTEDRVVAEWDALNEDDQRSVLSITATSLSLRRETEEARLRAQSDVDAAAMLASGPRLACRSASSVTPRRPTWLWRDWLAVGDLHLLIGRQGIAKSSFTAFVVASISTGRALPGGDGSEPLRCGVLSLEEPNERIVARLTATGADLGNVVLFGDVVAEDDEGREVRRPWRMPGDSAVLEEVIARSAIQVVVLDGVGFAISGDSHNYAVVGSALSSLASVAERTGAAIIGVTHTPKGTADPVTAAIGSTAWTAIPRVTWVLGLDPEDENRRVVRVGKSNYRYPDHGWSFSIGSDEQYECGYVTDVRESAVSAEELTAASETRVDRSERAEARDLIKSVLEDNGPTEVAKLLEITRGADISDRTVKRARADLGVVAEQQRDAGGRTTRWVLRLPDQPVDQGDSSPQDQPRLGPVGTLDVTRGNERSSGPGGQSAKSGPVEPWYSREEF